MSLPTKMKCVVCGNPSAPCKKNKGKTVWSFEIRLRSNCKQYMTVPCFIRNQVNSAMEYTMPVKTEDEDTYYFQLEKKSDKTRIYGVEYNEFLEDYDMQPYDSVRLEFISSSNHLMMQPLNNCGCPKNRLPDEFDFENEAVAVVYSRGVDPTPKQKFNISNVTLGRGLGLGVVFVHRLTKTDLKYYGLRIPKRIVSVLDITTDGRATVICGEEGAGKVVKYKPTKDGRMLLKSGWFKFAKKNSLKTGMIVVIMFHDVEDELQMTIDIVDN